MCYNDLGIAEALMQLRMENTRQEDERARLVLMARARRRQRDLGKWNQVVHNVGRQLSALGLRLEQAGQPHPSPQ